MPFLSRLALVLAKIEVTYGTDPVPTPAADSVRVFDLVVNPIGEELDDESVQATLDHLPHQIGSHHVEVTFSTWLKHSGTNDVPPEVGPLFRACGMAETITATTSVDYAPVSTGFESVTLYVYTDGLLHQVVGARGSFAIAATVGERARVNWRFLGKYVAVTDAAIPAGAVYDTTKGPVFLNGTFTYGGFAALIKNLELDLANELSVEPDPADATGVSTIEVVDRLPAGSMDPQAVTVATRPFFANWLAGAEAVLQAIIGTVAGNKITIDAPKVVKRSVAYGDRDKIRTFDIPFSLSFSSGDDSLQLTFD